MTDVADLVTPIIVAVISSGIAYVASIRQMKSSLRHSEESLRREYQLQSSVEKSVTSLLTRGWQARSFSVLKYHIRGFQDDELRQILVRCGAVAFQSGGREYWGILEMIEDRLPSKKGYEREGWTFRPQPIDPPKLD